MTTIKRIQAHRYEVELLQQSDDMAYIIRYQKYADEKERFSEQIDDLNIANMLFDMKVVELEGH